MSDDLELDDFLIPDEDGNGPVAIYARLVARFEEFEHLREHEPDVRFLLRTQPKVKNGRAVLGSCCMPSVQGELRPLFDWMLARLFGGIPDYLILLDREYWEQGTAMDREILVFHELMHTAQATDKHGAPRFDRDTGLPVWMIRGHDVEEFAATVKRYGAYSEDIRRFVAAASETE